MSDSRDDTSTAQIGSGPRSVVTPESLKRWNIARDVTAAVLLLLALALPWNLYFGVFIPGTQLELFLTLLGVTLLSLIGIPSSWHFKYVQPGRLRATLNVPYLLLVLGFVLFDLIQTVRDGGTADVPGGVGPGAWLGAAGALLGAQPPVTATPADNDRFRGWLLTARIVGYGAIVLAALDVVFNGFWRIKAAMPSGTSGFGKQNFAIIATAVVYGLVALITVVVASRWILQRNNASRLAVIALGASTLVAGVIVWSFPVGRQIDAFHGIAQNTSTAGVGFEGYLAWSAVAAIIAPLTLVRTVTEQISQSTWRQAARQGLLLVSLWCAASVLMRITDLALSVGLNLPYPPYDSAAMAAFDLFTAVLAAWLHVNLSNRSLPLPVISSLCGVLFVLSVSRIVIGVALAPRVAGSPAGLSNPVYGNNLAQQITSTFDVALSGLTLCILVVTIITGRVLPHRQPPARPDTKTTRLPTASAPTPRIFRPSATKQPAAAPKIYRAPQDSTAGGS